jgi:hypothetical protein
LSKTCIGFYSKNKFKKFVPLVGFIIRISRGDFTDSQSQSIYNDVPTEGGEMLVPNWKELQESVRNASKERNVNAF